MTSNCDGIREQPTPQTIHAPQVSEWTILANARRICKRSFQRSPNWVLAMEAFGLGSTWAWALCERIGVDPDGLTMTPSSNLADAHQSNPEGTIR